MAKTTFTEYQIRNGDQIKAQNQDKEALMKLRGLSESDVMVEYSTEHALKTLAKWNTETNEWQALN